MRILLISSVVLLCGASSARAVFFELLADDFDDFFSVVQKVQEQKDVVQFRQRLGDFKDKLYLLKEKDFIGLLGKSQAIPAKTYCMPVAQSRWLLTPAFGYQRGHRHTESCIIKDVAALEVRYGPDGECPTAIIIYFPTDKDFPKLTGDNLAKRLAWDEDHFKKLIAYCEEKKPEVFPAEKRSNTAPAK